MKNIESNNLFNQKNLKKNFILISISFILFSIIIFIFSIKTIETVLTKEANTTLASVSNQNVNHVKSIISIKKNILEKISTNFESDNIYNINEIVSTLKFYNKANGFYNMGVIDENGICYTTLDEKLDLNEYKYFIDGMNGISTVTSSYLSEEKNKQLNIFTQPIYKDNKVAYVLTATYESEEFSKLLSISSFNNKGNSMVITSNGDLISKSLNYDYNTLNDTVKFKQSILNLLTKSLDDKINKDNFFVDFDYENIPYLAYCEKIEVNDWYLISYAPKKDIYSDIDLLNRLIFTLFTFLYLSIVIALFILIRNYVTYKKKLTHIIFEDELTNEKNMEYLKQYFKNIKENEKPNKYLVVFDIDKFNNINIMHGIDFGDKLLKYISTTFKTILPNEEIFKYHSDVFVAIVNGTSEDEIISKLKKFKFKIKQDIESNKITPLKLSFGCCNLNEFDDLHLIYNSALISKNEIKENVNNKISFFNPINKNIIIENTKIETMFVDALKNDEFEIWYQPKYNMNTNEIYGAEALVRWYTKDNQFISPGKFIPIFENTGQILILDELVTEKVFKNIKEMQDLNLDIKPISINLSRVHIEHFEIIDNINNLLEKYKINPSYVSFEITESAMLGNNNLINDIINQLHNMGFKIDIDDYGTGNSTLSSICSADFDTLKLDKSYIDNIGNPKFNKIISSTINMANDLSMKVIAEGVENEKQIEFLLKNKCYIAQGFYYSKPINKLDYFELLKKKGL